jgi:hypothetical protein
VKIEYVAWTPRFQRDVEQIERADQVCRDYARQGFTLTLRQLYYQFVSRDWIANSDEQYKRLGDLVSKARRAGLLDWDHIVDRGRHLTGHTHWDSPAEIIRSAAYGYRIDTWEFQPHRVEVWVEKEALVDVVGRPAGVWDVDYFACKGYVSDSSIWQAARRLAGYVRRGQSPIVLHLGDHDPSGIDMSRDIEDRLRLFMADEAWDLEVRRIALNMDQIDQYGPPPNPAKVTDSRSAGYIEQYGNSSWELDALDPTVLAGLIDAEIAGIVDQDALDEARGRQTLERAQLDQVVAGWAGIVAGLEGGRP